MWGFWIFMFAMVALIPLTMIVFGVVFVYKPPHKINSLYGYRTTRSMKSQDTWDFAHKYSGKLMIIFGIITFILGAISYGSSFHTTINNVSKAGILGAIITCVEMVGMYLPIVFTEKALKVNFNHNGTKK